MAIPMSMGGDLSGFRCEMHGRKMHLRASQQLLVLVRAPLVAGAELEGHVAHVVERDQVAVQDLVLLSGERERLVDDRVVLGDGDEELPEG